MASEENLDYQIQGSGKNGTILKEDDELNGFKTNSLKEK